MPRGGLGLGLGLNRRQQRGFQAAATSGTGEDWLGQHQRVNRRATNIIESTTPGNRNTPRSARLQSFLHGNQATGALPGQTPWKGPNASTGAQPPPGAPAPAAPPGPPAVPPPPGTKPTLADIAEKYQINMPEELIAAGKGAIESWNQSKDWQNSAYEEQFNRLRQQSDIQGEKNAAALSETYGSMGARYGSDVQQAQADMRRKQTLDLQTAGFDVRQGLNQQRLAQMAGSMGAMENVGASKANIMGAGMEKAWQDYLMQMAPPSQWDEMMGYATSFNPPGQVVY